ncbi:flagellar motor switch protein FliG [Azospirillum thermophilum]|uniref:Flagellar motor switch protein FliG n=1 Tax=Azospirillum thermophilum TaxID=2202148 RepID=A0A2S2CUV5_9PROT|nr:flagellar motor switch protein FliG [Azospirillum thermophilum]AWK88268.1 flagellar motor switch protein FliG [Azospirillum thermophilum]
MGMPVKIRDNYKSLSGAEKSAIIFLALGEERGSRLMEKLDEDEIRMVSRAMAGLGNVTSNLVESLLRTFTERFANVGSVVGSYDTTERMLARFLPNDRVAEIMGEIRGPAGRTMWEKMSNVNEGVLAAYLSGEYPQTAAVILSRMRSEHAAKVLPMLPPNLRLEVIERMIQIESVQREVLLDIESILHNEFMANYARTHGSDTHERMAEIFNRIDRETLGEIFGDLEPVMPESMQRIKQLMFTFEDLLRLDRVSLQAVIRRCDTGQLAIALKGAELQQRDHFLSVLSERARMILQDEIENMGPVRMRDVHDAQAEIVQIAKGMADAGSIVIPQTGDADAVVY